MTPEPPGAIVAYRITHEKPGRTKIIHSCFAPAASATCCLAVAIAFEAARPASWGLVELPYSSAKYGNIMASTSDAQGVVELLSKYMYIGVLTNDKRDNHPARHFQLRKHPSKCHLLDYEHSLVAASRNLPLSGQYVQDLLPILEDSRFRSK